MTSLTSIRFVETAITVAAVMFCLGGTIQALSALAHGAQSESVQVAKAAAASAPRKS